jgi:hypothetical protein
MQAATRDFNEYAESQRLLRSMHPAPPKKPETGLSTTYETVGHEHDHHEPEKTETSAKSNARPRLAARPSAFEFRDEPDAPASR